MDYRKTSGCFVLLLNGGFTQVNASFCAVYGVLFLMTVAVRRKET
jgi:hypothetical protein